VEVEGQVVVGSLSTDNRKVGGVAQFLSESAIFIRGLKYDGTIPGESASAVEFR